MAKRPGHKTPPPSGERQYQHKIPNRDQLLVALNVAPGPLGLEALGAQFDIHADQHRHALEQRLKAMVRDGQIIRNRASKYCLLEQLDLITGRVQAHRDGFGFLIPDDGSDDLYLSGREMRRLWDGDRAAVRAGTGRRGGREGHVVEILSRGKTFVLGQFRRERGINYVLEHGDERTEVLIGRTDAGGAKPGDIVRVDIIEYPSERGHAIGRVAAIVGHHGASGVETDIAIQAHGIPCDWPEAVSAQAADVPIEVPGRSKEGRVDLRDTPLVTIDGADAKDFDDAVYAERQGSGWRLVVAIADVAHYVEPDLPLDREARARGTSVYFPDRVVPMLPEALSNGLCSLNPDVDRLCMVCDMQVSARGKVTGAEFYEAVMRSQARLTYGEAADILEGKKKVKRAALRDTLMPLHGVYKAFAGARKVRGALDFELTETVIELDDDGNVAAIRPLMRLVTHRIIEECMIAANVEAAKRIRKSRLPSLYRVHAGPDPKKEEELRLFLQTFDIKLPPKAKLEPLHLSRILQQAKGKPEAELIETVLLRSMSKAVYQVGNIGHFGLGLSAYAHFTSPIRRYPDLLVHRAIKWAISHSSSRGFAYSQDEMMQLGERCSAAERRADKAVWDVEEQLKCRYMQQHVGDEFRVIVASVVPFGLFVRVPELHIDGLIHVSALPPDYYHRDPSGTALVGERSGRRFQLTDRLTARLARVDLEERKIDFAPIEQETQSELPPVKRKRRKRG